MGKLLVHGDAAVDPHHEILRRIEEDRPMGMFDTVYAALDCPFCGRSYRHIPLSHEQAEREVRANKQWNVETRREFLRGSEPAFYMQAIWAKQDGFGDDVNAWIEQLDSSEHIEAYRTRRHLGLAEIQTKEFECVMADFYVGDEVPKYSGHYFIPETFACPGCSGPEETVYVKVWLEIEDRKLKAVFTRNPETGEPERERIHRLPPAQPSPNPHPSLHFKYRGLQAHAIYNDETDMYDMEVHHIPERFRYSHRDEDLLREIFHSFADDYLYLLGKGRDESPSLHEHLHTICRRLPSDFEPYGERERTGPDCSCGCRHFMKLPGKLGMDWGVCTNAASPRSGLLTFEHQGCEQFQQGAG
jgi:uncharacterized Zn-finger protein